MERIFTDGNMASSDLSHRGGYSFKSESIKILIFETFVCFISIRYLALLKHHRYLLSFLWLKNFTF